jgi:ureidoglycolate lyase
MKLIARAPDPEAFAPFGALIEGPARHGDRLLYSDWLVPVPDLALQFHVNSVPRSELPLTLDRIERHPRAAQVFVPLDVSRYVVTVAPWGEDGRPDLGAALCMVVPGSLGVAYRPDCWHAGVTVLDRDAHFAVLMWRGATDDDVFHPVAPVTVHADVATHSGPCP